jgi:predicted ATPase
VFNCPTVSRHPDDLYKNGIQRSSFLPAIDLLKSQFKVTDLDSGTGKKFKKSSMYISDLVVLVFLI